MAVFFIHTDQVVTTTDPKRFLGFCIDADQFEGDDHESCLWELRNPVIHNLCRALKPATIRLGGAGIERIEFVADEAEPHELSDPYHFVFGHEKADLLGDFCRSINTDLMLSFPIKDGDIDNAIRFADYFVHQRGDPVPFLELGNEPDWGWGDQCALYPERVRDFHQAMRAHFPDQQWIGGYGGRSYPFGISNPDTDNYRRFIETCGDLLDVFSVHYYTCSANREYSTAAFMLDPYATDIAALRVKELKRLLLHAGLGDRPITINEFNTFASQGIDGISNSMMAAAWIADMVGNMALAGSHMNNIQCGFGRKHGRYEFWRYAMIDTSGRQIRINPHFYAFYLWNRFMGHEHLLCSGASSHPVSVHATRRDGAVQMLVTNKSLDTQHEVELRLIGAAADGEVELFTIEADSPQSSVATINGTAVDDEGKMGAIDARSIPVRGGVVRLRVDSCSIALVQLPGR